MTSLIALLYCDLRLHGSARLGVKQEGSRRERERRKEKK